MSEEFFVKSRLPDRPTDGVLPSPHHGPDGIRGGWPWTSSRLQPASSPAAQTGTEISPGLCCMRQTFGHMRRCLAGTSTKRRKLTRLGQPKTVHNEVDGVHTHSRRGLQLCPEWQAGNKSLGDKHGGSRCNKSHRVPKPSVIESAVEVSPDFLIHMDKNPVCPPSVPSVSLLLCLCIPPALAKISGTSFGDIYTVEPQDLSEDLIFDNLVHHVDDGKFNSGFALMPVETFTPWELHSARVRLPRRHH